MQAIIKIRIQEQVAVNRVELDTKNSMPEGGSVISRSSDGAPLSYYRDSIWDLGPYRMPSGVAKIKFAIKGLCCDDKIIEEVKREAYLILFVQSISLLSVMYYRKLVNTLVKIGAFCTSLNCSLERFWESPEIRVKYTNANPSQIKYIISIINFFQSIDRVVLGFDLVCDVYIDAKIKRISDEIISEYEQTLPIPQRIYSELISRLLNLISIYLNYEVRLFEIMDECVSSPTLGRTKISQQKYYRKNGLASGFYGIKPNFNELVVSHGLEKCFDVFGVQVKSLRSIVKLFTRVQLVVKIIIHLFSGMRDSEVGSLLLNCIRTENDFDRTHYIIDGVTTKLNSGLPKKAWWVTSVEGHRAIVVAQRLSDRIYSWSEKKLTVPVDSRLLFPTAMCIKLFSVLKEISDNNNPATLDFSGHSDFIDKISPVITEEDLIDLKLIDPSRLFDKDSRFMKGSSWPLSTHQFRRSLCLYGTASGYITLPSLKRQMKHTSEELSLYYSKGSSVSRNLLLDAPMHFCKQYQDSQFESEALSYIVNVIDSKEDLFGAYGAWMSHGGRDFLSDREDTIAKFKKGLIRYASTPLGGCTSIEPCPYRAMASFVKCVSCKNVLIKISSLDLVISEYENYINKLKNGTAEYSMVNDDLLELKRLRSGISKGGCNG